MHGWGRPHRRSLDQFPFEILVMIMKELPDFASLHCLMVASNAALLILEQRSMNKEILDCMRAKYGLQVTDLDMKLALGIPWDKTDRLSDLAGISLVCTRPISRVQRASLSWLIWVYLKTNKRGLRRWQGLKIGNSIFMVCEVLRWRSPTYDSDQLYARVHGRVANMLKANEIVFWLGLKFPRIEDWTGNSIVNDAARTASQVEYRFFKGCIHTGGGWLLPDCYLVSALEENGYYGYPLWRPIQPLLNKYANHVADKRENDHSGTIAAPHGSHTYSGTVPCRWLTDFQI